MNEQRKEKGDFAVETEIADQEKAIYAARKLVRIMARQAAFDHHTSCGTVAEGGSR